MSLFKSVTHQEIWIEHHCHRCWHNPGCPILAKALRTDRKPVEWDRNPRKNALMQDSIKCNSETRQPPTIARATVADETLSMFDVSAPVDMDTEHA